MRDGSKFYSFIAHTYHNRLYLLLSLSVEYGAGKNYYLRVFYSYSDANGQTTRIVSSKNKKISAL